MPQPFRLRVQVALTEALKEITVANGFTVDLDEAVFRGRNVFGDTDPVPMLSILEAPIPEDPLEAPESSQAASSFWQLVIQGWAVDDAENPTDPAQYLMADVKQKLAELKSGENSDEGVLGLGTKAPCVVGLDFGLGVVRPSDELSAKAYFWLTLSLEIVEDHSQPYG